MRWTALHLSLAATLAMGSPVGAVLRHYRIEWTAIAEFNTANPQLNNYEPGNRGPAETRSRGLIDDHGDGSPVLKTLRLVQEVETSFPVSIVYCHSSPTYICTYTGVPDLMTMDPMLPSPFYDLGTWTFHGTGFTSVPFVQRVAAPTSLSMGNAQYWLKGRLSGGFVPALPLLGVALLGASLLFAGARLSRKRR